jgi:aspartate/methionine/tyrosine aminotransferase
VAPDPAELVAAIGPDTVAVLLMGFEMPTGALLYTEHLDAITEPVTRHVAWVIYDAAKERIRFDDQLLPC